MSRRVEESSDDDSDEDYDLGTLAAGFLYLVHNGRVVQKRETRALTRFYHTRASLPPNSRMGTPWQQLYASKIDRAFILFHGAGVRPPIHLWTDAAVRCRRVSRPRDHRAHHGPWEERRC